MSSVIYKFIGVVLPVIWCVDSSASSFEVVKKRYCNDLENTVAIIGTALNAKKEFMLVSDALVAESNPARQDAIAKQGETVLNELEQAELALKEKNISHRTESELEQALAIELKSWALVCR